MSRNRSAKAKEDLTAEKAAQAVKETARDVNKTVADTIGIVKETAAVAQDTARTVAKKLPKPRMSKRKTRARKPRATKVRRQIKLKAARKGRKSKKD
jgi:hypothetical protein